MSKRIATYIATCLLSAIIGMSTGCLTFGPTLGVVSVPMPLSPTVQGKAEDEAFEKANYRKVAILDPITEGNHVALDEPSDDQVVRLLEKIRPLSGAVPGLETSQRVIKGIVKEKMVDFVDPPRFYPLVGPAQLHHVHFKCTVYFSEIANVGWPVPHTVPAQDCVEVLTIDMDHLHRVAGGTVE